MKTKINLLPGQSATVFSPKTGQCFSISLTEDGLVVKAQDVCLYLDNTASIAAPFELGTNQSFNIHSE